MKGMTFELPAEELALVPNDATDEDIEALHILDFVVEMMRSTP